MLKVKKIIIIILNKQEVNIRKFKFYYRDKEIDIGKQYTYLGFTFTQSRKKQVGIDNLINKARKAWFCIQKKCYINQKKKQSVFI